MNAATKADKTMCGKRTARFLCTLPAGHAGPHGRQYRRPLKTYPVYNRKGQVVQVTIPERKEG